MKKTLLRSVFMATFAVSLFVSCQKQEFVEPQDDSKNDLSMVDKAKEFVMGQYAQTKGGGISILPPNSEIAWERAVIVSDEWGTAVNIPINNTTLDFSFYNEYTNKFIKRTDARQDLVYIRKLDDSGNEIEEAYLVSKIYRKPSVFSLSPITNANFELSGEFGVGGSQPNFSGLIFWHRSDGSIHRISEYGNGTRNFSMTYSKPKNVNPLYFSLMDTQPDIVIMRTEPLYNETWQDGCCVVIGQYTSNGTNFNLVRQFAMLQFMLQYSDGGGSATGEVGMGGGSGGSGYATTTYIEPVHNTIIDVALKGKIDYVDLQKVKDGSKKADSYPYQKTEYCYMHFLREKNQSLVAAESLLRTFFIEKINLFYDIHNPNRYVDLGMALHPIMDSYAPAHYRMQFFDSSLMDWIKHFSDIGDPISVTIATNALSNMYDKISAGKNPKEIFDNWLNNYK